MDSLVSTAMHQKAKESKMVNDMMHSHGRKHYNIPPPPLTYAQVANPRAPQVVQPRARRASSVKKVTNWQQAEGFQDQYPVQKPYTHIYDRGMSDYSRLGSSDEEEYDPETVARLDSPFHPHFPYVSDTKTLRQAVDKDADLIFSSIVLIMGELQRVREENNSLKNENTAIKENWMDVTQQAIEIKAQLTQVQRELAKTQEDLKAEQEDFSQRRRDWYNRAQRYEELVAIGSAKQVVLWKFIERIKEGHRPKGASLKKTESGWDVAVCEVTDSDTTLTTDAFDSPGSAKTDTTITEFRSPERPTFNPAASSFVPGAASPVKSIGSVPSTAGTDTLNQPVDILSCILSLPPRFYGICPYSLCAPTGFRCTLPSCRLQHACEAYNDEKGDGCHNPGCRFVHEYRSCHEEIDGFGCRFMNVNKESILRRGHLEKRIHEQNVSPEEWGARVIIAGLRGAHQEGKY